MSVPSPKHIDPARRPWYGNKLALVFGSIGAVVVLCLAGLTITGLFLPDPPPKPPKVKTAATRPAAPAPTAAPSSRPPSPVPSTSPPAPPPIPITTTDPPTGNDPTHMICKVSDVGGIYYLDVTSAFFHLEVCDGAERYPGTIDDLFKLPNVDRRCVSDNEYAANFGAIVGVYSDTTPVNLEVANQYCRAHKWSNR